MDKNIKIIVISYDTPDLDGTASAIAYSELLNKIGQESQVYFTGDVQTEVKFVFDSFKFNYPAPTDNVFSSLIVLVDIGPKAGIPNEVIYENVKEVIDHHSINDHHLFPNANIQNERVGAAATLIAEKFQESLIKPSRMSNILLHTGIISNTLNFQSKTTTQRDKNMAAWLDSEIKLPQDFAFKMFEAKSDFSGSKLIIEMENTLSSFQFGDKKIKIYQLEIVNGTKFARDRLADIQRQFKKVTDANVIFLSIISLNENKNIFIANSTDEINLLNNILNVKFNKQIGIRPGLIMRKEIAPLIKEYYDKN